MPRADSESDCVYPDMSGVRLLALRWIAMFGLAKVIMAVFWRATIGEWPVPYMPGWLFLVFGPPLMWLARPMTRTVDAMRPVEERWRAASSFTARFMIFVFGPPRWIVAVPVGTAIAFAIIAVA